MGTWEWLYKIKVILESSLLAPFGCASRARQAIDKICMIPTAMGEYFTIQPFYLVQNVIIFLWTVMDSACPMDSKTAPTFLN